MDQEHCYRAVRGRDARFDGSFVTAVRSTGIYCRPSCPAMTPKRTNMVFYRTAAAAQGAGFRACKRCRPDATPGSPEWNVRADLVGRAMRLIADGVVDREGVGGLAARLGYSERNVHRQLVLEVGAGPLALATAQRAQTARTLLETTTLPIAQVAFAAGFSSVRRFNETIREVFALTPGAVRAGARDPVDLATPGALTLRLPLRAPFDAAHLFGFLAARAVEGVEEGSTTRYRRTVALPHGPATVDVRADDVARGWVTCTLGLTDLRDLAAAVQRCRRLLDLDADPAAVVEVLGRDRSLGPMVRRRPGVRIPGHVDGDEVAVRAILGQQVSVVGARTLASRLTARFGEPLTAPDGALTHVFPDAATLAGLAPGDLGIPGARAAALLGLCRALADGTVSLDPGADRDEVSARLLALRGIGPWTVAYIRMRALSDPDAFLPTDLAIVKAMRALGLPASGAAIEHAERWRPWRGYALQHLWLHAATLAEARRKEG